MYTKPRAYRQEPTAHQSTLAQRTFGPNGIYSQTDTLAQNRTGEYLKLKQIADSGTHAKKREKKLHNNCWLIFTLSKRLIV